jgi:DNA helicase-2/ATP-dependent DNA helicase PcrA
MNLDLLINQLNDKQKEAVESYGFPILVLAPAGSGKTRVITFKIMYLIEKIGLNPSKIVSLTFTNKAANEMKSRIIDLLPTKGKSIVASTFHSYSVKLLRKYSGLLGYKENFSIYDFDDSISVINRIKKELKLDIDSNILLYTISSIKNSINSFEQYNNLIEANEFSNIIKQYIEYLKSHNAMDFDDLLLNLFFLLTNKEKDCIDASEKIRDSISYLLVDEYQDTNKLQYLIVKELLKNRSNHNNVTVVGDDDQGIYSFRGSTIENILRFENDFPGCKVICLEKNYRSSQIILHAAKNVIKNNQNRKNKEMKTDNPYKGKITIFEANNPQQEALFVYDKIYQLLYKDGIRYKDIAILYRNNHLARSFEELFILKNLKHKVWGGYNFYAREEIRDVSAYLFSLLNPYDEVSLLRIINIPKRGIGTKLVEKLVTQSKQNGIHIFDILKIISNDNEFKESVLVNFFNENEREALKNFYELFAKYRQKIFQKDNSFSVIFNAMIEEIGYKDYLKLHNDEKTFDNKIGYLESFLSSLYNYRDEDDESSFQNPYKIAERLRLLMNNDIEEKEEDCINLMTIHSAKGLEFRVVFIVGAEKGIIPSSKIVDIKELEEERRLFYVAMTRAKEFLFISFCNERSKFGKKFNCFPSEFIEEIPNEDIIYDTKKNDATVTASDIASIKNLLLNKKK